MTREQREYIHQLVEGGIGTTEEVWKAFRKRFPGQSFIWDDIASEKKAYLFRKYGIRVYTKGRVAAARIFEAGGTAVDVHKRLGTSMHRANAWEEEWRSVKLMKQDEARPAPRAVPKHRFPSGAVFGSWTDRNSIWSGGR